MRSGNKSLRTVLILVVVCCVALILYHPSVWTFLLLLGTAVLGAVYTKRRQRPTAQPQAPEQVQPNQPIAMPPAKESALQSQSPQDVFAAAVDRLGIKVKKYSGTEVVDEYGTSFFHFEIEGLEVTDGELSGLRFVVESEAGYVTRPKVGTGRLRVRWDADSICRELTLPIKDAVECARKMSGVFTFAKLRPGNPALSFDWTFTILNCHAMTEWENKQLYGDQPSADRSLPQVGGKEEYFARIAWFPTETFCMSMKLPPRLAQRLSLGVERLKGSVEIPRDQVVRDNVLQGYPRADSEWVKNEVRWEGDSALEQAETALLQLTPLGTCSLELKKPPVGSRHIMAWPLPQRETSAEFEYLVGRSQEVRQKSLEHASHRKLATTSTSVDRFMELFSAFDKEIRGQYALDPDREEFTTTLMTYDQAARRLVIVESRINGQEISTAGWDFSLPFGFGLSGACFKEGTNVFMYVGNQDTAGDDAKYYLPVQGSVAYQILLALPVDHRDFVESKKEDGEPVWERSRQLIGVMSVGSSSTASKLHEFAVELEKAPKPAQDGRTPQAPSKTDKLHQLRARCQKLGDDLCDLYQPPSGTAQAKSEPG